jgi:hypothetical protein
MYCAALATVALPQVLAKLMLAIRAPWSAAQVRPLAKVL